MTNTDSLNRKNRRRKTISRIKKVKLNTCTGYYVQQWNKQPARIELFVDVIISDYPRWILNIGFISDVVISKTFFHELGHHIHKTQAPEHKGPEDVADKWSKHLSKKYFWKRYWHVMALLTLFKPFFDWLLNRYDKKNGLNERKSF